MCVLLSLFVFVVDVDAGVAVKSRCLLFFLLDELLLIAFAAVVVCACC